MLADWSDGYVPSNGIAIHYERSNNGASSKPPMLLLHGLFDDGLCWTALARGLQEHYDLIMLDARGHGLSDPPTAAYTAADQASDALSVLHALGIDKPIVMGHSMGSQTALTLAATHPDLPRAVLLEDPLFTDTLLRANPRAVSEDVNQPTYLERMEPWIRDLQSLTREDLLARGRLDNPGWVDEVLIPWAEAKQRFRLEVLRYVPGPHASVPTWRASLDRVTIPLLVITGNPERGAIVTPAIAQEVAQTWPHCTVAHLPEAGHCIRFDCPTDVLAITRSFLQQHVPMGEGGS